MTNQKLMMFAVAGLLVPAADAAAEIRQGKTTMVVPHPVADKAPTTGTPLRLKKTDSEQAGNEHSSFALFADGKTGLHFALTTELPGVNPGDAPRRANHRAQLSATPFSLIQAADGSVEVKADIAKSKFVTNNLGNEYRNAHASTAFAIDGGAAVCAQYNYQPANQGDTKLYTQCFNAAGQVVMAQTESFAKNNDDCSMAETKSQLIDKVGNTERYVRWHGCNGNGSDDAWVGVASITKTATGYTYKRDFDLSVIANEERSRGNCFVVADAQPFALCAGTAGNNQPQRDGAYLLAVDLDAKFKGPNQQAALLWKKQISGRQTLNGATTYSMRAMLNPVLQLNAAGQPAQTDMFFWRHGLVQGNNNDNNKGGEYKQNMMAVVKATRAGMQYVTPLAGQAFTSLLGIDGTHNLITSVMVGAGADLKPGLIVHNGSHTGGNSTSAIRAIGFDQAGGKLNPLGSFTGPYADRHYYSNYLGNNPGNQGRNHSQATFIPNPFFGQGGNTDKFLLVTGSTGKGTVTDPAVKLAAYMSVMPVASGAAAGPAPTGTATPAPTGTATPAPGTSGATTDEPVDGSDTTLGGCSTSGSAGGLATFLLIGLAAFIRRRR